MLFQISMNENKWKWKRLPDMIQGRNDHMCGVAYGKVIVAGGDINYHRKGSKIQNTDSVELLDLKTLKWNKGPCEKFNI